MARRAATRRSGGRCPARFEPRVVSCCATAVPLRTRGRLWWSAWKPFLWGPLRCQRLSTSSRGSRTARSAPQCGPALAGRGARAERVERVGRQRCAHARRGGGERRRRGRWRWASPAGVVEGAPSARARTPSPPRHDGPLSIRGVGRHAPAAPRGRSSNWRASSRCFQPDFQACHQKRMLFWRFRRRSPWLPVNRPINGLHSPQKVDALGA